MAKSKNVEKRLAKVEGVACVFQDEFREDLAHWTKTDARTAQKVLAMVDEVMRTPTTGTGKPEHLRHLGANVWSRRVTKADRLVYLVREGRIDFLQCRYHY